MHVVRRTQLAVCRFVCSDGTGSADETGAGIGLYGFGFRRMVCCRNYFADSG